MRRTGVSLIEEDRILLSEYESPFPYDTNVLLAIPDSGPLPDEDGYSDWVESAVVSLIQASAGHALVLFTSMKCSRGPANSRGGNYPPRNNHIASGR